MESRLDTSKTEWDLSPLLSSLDDPVAEKDLAQVRAAYQRFADIWQERDDYLTDPGALRAALDDYEVLHAQYGVNAPRGLYGNLATITGYAISKT